MQSIHICIFMSKLATMWLVGGEKAWREFKRNCFILRSVQLNFQTVTGLDKESLLPAAGPVTFLS